MRAWLFAVPLLAALVTSSAACGGATSVTTPSSATPVEPGPRHFVPSGLSQVTFVGFDLVGFQEADLHEAEQTRRAVDVELERSYQRPGHRRWFFYAFDRKNLDFVVARYQPTPQKGARYIAEHRMRVKRTPESERSLVVTDAVRQYELGERGVKPGMASPQVEARLGKAPRQLPLGSNGSFDMLYPSLCIRFVDQRVAHVWPRARCAVRP